MGRYIQKVSTIVRGAKQLAMGAGEGDRNSAGDLFLCVVVKLTELK